MEDAPFVSTGHPPSPEPVRRSVDDEGRAPCGVSATGLGVMGATLADSGRIVVVSPGKGALATGRPGKQEEQR